MSPVWVAFWVGAFLGGMAGILTMALCVAAKLWRQSSYLVIKKVAEDKGLSEIQAMIDIMTKLEGKEVAQMWVMAAYVEMVEPSV